VPKLETKPRSEAAGHLKAVALRLFAERGVDGVTVREIAEAAGQKNHAAVGYHFGSKEGLIRELILDGAVEIDARRNDWLDRLEQAPDGLSVRAIVDILVFTSVGLAAPDAEDCYNRFVVLLGMSHRAFFMDTLAGRWNAGYLRCLRHLRRLMPDMPPAMKNQRFVFLGAYLGAVMAIRETELADRSRPHPTWGSSRTLEHFAHTATALIEAPAP
jgi:AcrR family transcriptional regulator